MSTPPGEPNGVLDHLQEAIDIPHINGHGGVNGHAQVNGHDEANGHSPSGSQGTESPSNQQNPPGPPSPETLEELPAFDWEEFEARYEAALSQASEEERVVLKEAEALSKYFQAWASAASARDDARAVKRLQTRQRFVNLSEERLSQKQQHYVEVVRAFESALALLKSS